MDVTRLGVRRVAGSAARRLRPRSSASMPTLSVVIAAGGADEEAAILDECLRSALSSTHAALEILVAGRRVPARSWARRVRSLPEASVEDAVARASGEYLAFMNPADLVRVDAWDAMVTALQGSGSGLVVGGRRAPKPRPGETHLFSPHPPGHTPQN